MACTIYSDTHGSGYLKSPFDYIFIDGTKSETRPIFEALFGCPDRVTCSCCGSDYSIMDGEDDDADFAHASGYYRGANDVYIDEAGNRYTRTEYPEPHGYEDADGNPAEFNSAWKLVYEGGRDPDDYASDDDVLYIPAWVVELFVQFGGISPVLADCLMESGCDDKIVSRILAEIS